MKKIVSRTAEILGLKSVRERLIQKKNNRQIRQRINAGELLIDCSDQEKSDWEERIAFAVACADNEKINCLPNTGKIVDDFFIMHNGIKILPLSYYGYPMLKLLLTNRGIHEPQEEYVFQEVLKFIPVNATMIELGAYWSFYSMWFNKKIKGAKNYMLEPWEIQHGIRNFKLNNLSGKFFRYYIADNPGFHNDGTPIISIDHFVTEQKLEFVDVLHSDIQGNELLMLKGAENLLKNFQVGYIFVSTHSDSLHSNCADFLNKLGYLQVCSADMKQTFSYDGLLVYKNPNYPGVEKIDISLR